MMSRILELVQSIESCNICEPFLENGVRPVIQISSKSKILIAGQAPGLKVHQSGIPFDDASGDRLRKWLGLERSEFYNAEKVAIVPMGFCYPGKGKTGDLPPRKECKETWHASVMKNLKNVVLTLAVGKHAIDYHFQDYFQQEGRATLTEMVRNWSKYQNQYPLPHPSPRNNLWLKKNQWFEKECIGPLQKRIRSILSNP